MKAVIIGGGIMGLSAAWALSRAGWRVELLERGRLPNPDASSSDRSRLIRYPYGRLAGYMAMVTQAFDAWQCLWDDLGTAHYRETGALMLETPDAAWARDSASTMKPLGLPLERLDAAALEARFPILLSQGLDGGWLSPRAGVLQADRILADLADRLRAGGVVLLPETPVVEIDPDKASATTAQGWLAEGDLLVVCAGAWTRGLLPDLSNRLVPSRQLVLYLEPPLETLLDWRDAPMVLDVAGDSGCYIVPPGPSAPLKLGDHRFSMTGHPDDDRTPEPMAVRALFDTARGRLRGLDAYKRAGARVCYYTVAPDERFLVEPLGSRAWLMAGFSGHGFKFGPLMGLALAHVVGGPMAQPAADLPGDAAALTAWAAGRGGEPIAGPKR